MLKTLSEKIDLMKQAWKGLVDGIVKDSPKPAFNGKYEDIYMKLYKYGSKLNYVSQERGAYKCNLCFKRFPNRRTLKIHFTRNHKDYVVKQLPESLKRFFKVPTIRPLV